MKKRIVSFVAVLAFLSFFSGIAFAEFWGSKNSNKYHNTSCKWAQKIKPANLEKFNTPEKAIGAGYIPCKVCKPPSVTKSENDTENCLKMAQISYNNDPERRGCCSWHGGVCGCSGGRALCCDGTLSPSCGCN